MKAELVETDKDGAEKILQQQHEWAQGPELMINMLANESQLVQVSMSRNVSACDATLSNYMFNTSFGKSQLVD